jgi:putative ABC transport system ATP-binding protein
MIALENISRIFTKDGGVEVKGLDNVSLNISRGEFIAIIGPSGSGKSTLLNTLGFLDRPTSGRYIFEGKQLSGQHTNTLARVRNREIGFVFQSFHLLHNVTALENVELPLIYSDKKDIRKLAENALISVGLADRMDHKPNELSGGQQQRVAIARALVNQPSMILADEPTGNLDSKSSEEILQIFTALNQQGKTIIMITHEPEIAQKAGRIIRISDGKIVSDQPSETIKG